MTLDEEMKLWETRANDETRLSYLSSKSKNFILYLMEFITDVKIIIATIMIIMVDVAYL